MGIISSCLGERRSALVDPETSRLLSDDPYRSQYGSHIQHARPVYQPDPESVRREREALENICNAMSDNVIDVFNIQPQPSYPRRNEPSSPESSHSNPQINGDTSPEEMKLRTIKKGRGGPIFTTLGKGAAVSKAVQEAIG